MAAVPLRLPPAPFELGHAQTAAAVVSEAYRVHRAWKAADKPEPDAFALPEFEELAEVDEAAAIWTVNTLGPFERHTPVALAARIGAAVFVGFRGTENPSDILTNLELAQRDYDVPGCAEFGPVHGGFMDRYAQLRPSLVRAVFEGLLTRAGVERVVVAGHSMGAAISTLAIPDLARNAVKLERVALVHYTFGSPRVGSRAFARTFDALAEAHGWQNVMSYRIANSADPVTSTPPAILERLIREDPLFQHVGTAIGFTQNYASVGHNHHHARTYCHALAHPDDPYNPDADQAGG